MEKLAFFVLILVSVYSVGYHFGRKSAKDDFRSQMKSHKDFYEHNCKVVGEK